MTGEQIAGVIDEYETWMRSWGAAKRTIEARGGLARRLLEQWGLDGFTPERLSTFLAGPKEGDREWSKWTRSTYYSHLREICTWLYGNGYLEENPIGEVRSPKRPKAGPRPLTEPQVARVLSVAEGDTRTWIQLALLAGLRASEVAAIKGEDVDESGIYVLGKGETGATLPCHPELWEIAQHYPRRGYWFPGTDNGHIRGQMVSATVGKFFRALGIDGSLHRCRHVYGTRLLRKGVNIRTVQKLMRHANLETTATYTAVDEDELREAINLLPSA